MFERDVQNKLIFGGFGREVLGGGLRRNFDDHSSHDAILNEKGSIGVAVSDDCCTGTRSGLSGGD
jgi:hypothetical protein